ncbi:fructosamine kinase family protein [Aestuariirhabdus sp. Z084]|uniref:fructosamine kinase family protein n=1 Tax=Aestuariirhabdus haliotis TaxID=2918751 RepID=UPI00201B357A|nr:fructosamine kinase family protein [Aestuariirhabdus haliotis]MCL6414366.1 fructosamine kinase family protein [Aestuariirhabdus haliotis]MCL6418298.1 fructosamine kinase family protein [Aestuariirhabdus haliotis]
MLANNQRGFLEQCLGRALKTEVSIQSISPVSGGDINGAWRLSTTAGCFFVKHNTQAENQNFATEANSLRALARCESMLVPRVIACERGQGDNYLLLEYLSLRPGNGSALGKALACLHRQHTGEAYGWPEDNFIGRTVQRNKSMPSWASFFARCRIEPQLILANQRGANLGEPEFWVVRVEALLANHQPEPSLLHGDLWAGNAALSDKGEAVLFDPASYYGDRETDLAMTQLFGGFDHDFYRAYQAEWPLPTDCAQRQTLYQLYHVLNHFNLFGGFYRDRALSMLELLPG